MSSTSAVDVTGYARCLEEDGYAIIPDFLSADDLAEVRRVLALYLGTHNGRNDFEGTLTERVYTLVARGRARAELDRLEARATARNASFVLGETLSRADTTWLPFVELAVRGGVALDASSWVAAWRERMHRRPSFDATYPPHWRTTPRPA